MTKRIPPHIKASDIRMGIVLLAEKEFESYNLNRRQRQIAHRMFLGESGSHIAKKLFITPSCVRYHMSNIYNKTKTKNREEFLQAIWQGIIFSRKKWNSRADMRKDSASYSDFFKEWNIE